MKARKSGFTLVELLVVVGVIAILMSILLPALARARESAATVKCAANLRSIGQGLMQYAANNNQYLPLAYEYRGQSIDYTTNTETPATATWGYIHWSSHIMGTVSPEAFKCPSIANGGLPATDPMPGGFDAGQTTDTGSDGSIPLPASLTGRATAVDAPQAAKHPYWPDAQAPRIAYTLNEAVCGRNKLVVGFQGATSVRTYRNVALTEIDNPSGTILATEFVDEWGIVSGVDRGGAAGVVCKSHRPAFPFRADGTTAGDSQCDGPTIPTATKLRRSTAADLWKNADGSSSLDIIQDYKSGAYTNGGRMSRLDWVGRNHGKAEHAADNKSNFLYCDGHVETKSILDTVPKDSTDVNGKWEWGKQAYSLSPNATTGN